MARHRSLLSQIQRDSYLVSRSAGDLHAASRGPQTYARRRVRRMATRSVFGALRSLTK